MRNAAHHLNPKQSTMTTHPKDHTVPRAMTRLHVSNWTSEHAAIAHAQPDETDLLRRARAGSADAISALWELHWQPCLAYARYIAQREDPEELVAEAMSRVLRAIARGLGPTSHFSAYLKRAIRNLAISRSRRRFEVVVDPQTLIALAPTTADNAADRALARDVHQTMASLPPRYRAALIYNELEKLPMRQWAPRLGISEGAAAALASRARRAFRHAWLDAQQSDALHAAA